MADTSLTETGPPPRSAGELFLVFAWISMQSFGGALTFIEKTVVRDKRWLSPTEFLGLYAISQVLPDPTGISFCVLLGDRFFGLRGAAAALGCFLLLPSVVIRVWPHCSSSFNMCHKCRAPCTAETGSTHERTGSPFICTV